MPWARRPTFRDLFDLVARTTAAGDINIVANSDIFFDGGLRVLRFIDWPRTVLALTRWDVLEDGTLRFFERHDSQDSWIFQGPLAGFAGGDFAIGQPHCDNRLAHELRQSGYRVWNPSLSLRSYHLHQSAHRTYRKPGGLGDVPPPHAHVLPRALDGPLRNLWNAAFHRERYALSRGTRATLRLTRYDYFKRRTEEAFHRRPLNPLALLAGALGAAWNYHYLRKLSQLLGRR